MHWCPAPSDYTTFAEMLTFTPMDSRFCYNMTVINDQLFEGQEDFTVTLSTSAPSVSVQPETAIIIITDDDRKYFLFIIIIYYYHSGLK